jgi:hypothetical protein
MGEVPNIKAEALRMIEALPDDVTLEDIQYHLYVIKKVQAGIRSIEEEGSVSHEEAKRRFAKWLAP